MHGFTEDVEEFSGVQLAMGYPVLTVKTAAVARFSSTMPPPLMGVMPRNERRVVAFFDEALPGASPPPTGAKGARVQLIGFLGGMSWESSAEYYRLANEMVRNRRGGLHSARCLLYSVDFAAIEAMQAAGRWEEAAGALSEAARALEAGGADFIVLCTNTMHKVADVISGSVQVPLLHIADTTAAAVWAQGVRRVGLLGTGFTMSQPFYAGRLATHGLDVIVPSVPDQAEVHRIIYEELCLGVLREESRETYRRVIRGLVDEGAQGVIYGCTEIELLVGPADSSVPVFPTTSLHVEAAVQRALDADEVRRPELP